MTKETPEPSTFQLPEVRKLDEIADKVIRRLTIAEVDWSQSTNLCSVSDVKGRIDLMRNVMRDGMTYLQDSITLWAIRKGWLTEEPRNPAEQLMLIVTELAEACEAFRMGNPPCERPGMEQYSHAAEELADVVIRCFQMAGEHDIPLAEVIQAKMVFNETRPAKHGKKF
jgi:NTP pyrophosphatase (non-canonical NTP hydrolase)